MTDLQRPLTKRESLIDEYSVGHELTQVLYGRAEPRAKHAKNKKMPVNLRLRTTDLELIDALAVKFSRTRGWIISYLLETDIERILESLDSLDTKMQWHLVTTVDKQITTSGLNHDFNGKTWEWTALHPDTDIGNPGNESILDILQRDGEDQ